MARYLLSIDDTDMPGTPGSGHVLEAICRDLEAAGLGHCASISRHQLFVHPDVPFTSHNSAMCTVVSNGGGFEALLDLARRRLVELAVDGSDPGLCLVDAERIADIERLSTYGGEAKTTVLTKDRAYRTAAACGIHLEELGGTGDGVIGALAGVALRLGGNDGRFRGRIAVGASGETLRGAQVLAITGIDALRQADDLSAVPEDVTVTAEPEAKVVLREGLAVLPLRPQGTSWRCLTREETKELFP